MTDLLDALCARLATDLDIRGRAHADCPFCGALAAGRAGGAAYHFYLYDLRNRRGAVCWSCGWRGSLAELARELDVAGEDIRPPRVEPEPPTPPWARRDAVRQWAAFVGDPDRQRQIVAAWQRYKPLAPATIARELLGYGRMSLYDERRRQWYAMRHPRLLVPLIVGARLVGFRGRAIERADTGPKWLTASYSEQALLGLEEVGVDSTVIWCENLADRLLAREREPGAVIIASGGLSWRPGWIATLARRRPRHVLIWFDHDLSGNGSVHHEAEYLALWRAEQERRRAENPQLAARPFPQPPEPRGPRLAAELLAAGVAASVYAWPRGTPRAADLGWALTHDARRVA